MLSIANLSYAPNGVNLFSNITFKIAAGEMLNIYGRNGSGKTTLIKLLATILPSEPGSINYNKRQVAAKDSSYLQEIVYLGHKTNYHPDLTVLENFTYKAALQGLQNVNYKEALAYFNLSPCLHRNLASLSCGQIKKLALSQLFISTASIWLLDEPLANLDTCGENLLLSLIKNKLAQQGLVILTSHSPLEELSIKAKYLNLDVAC